MKIDKQINDICFNESEHYYWNKNNDLKYDSVTTIIGTFYAEFDKDFWSAYKALEKLLGKDEFKFEKKRLMDSRKVDKDYYLNTYNISENDFNATQQEILDQWQKTTEDSCIRGTKIHKELEEQYTTKQTCDISKYGIGGKIPVIKQNYTFQEDKGVYPECLIYRTSNDGQLRIAGQIDLLIKNNNDIIIIDYKTNAEIKQKSFYNSKLKKYEMMKYPLNNLMDCNYVHYCLQLSTYAWMLQQINPEFNIKKLILIHYDHLDNVTTYEVEYLKEDVERMLKFYKRQSILKESQRKREPIKF